MLFRSALGVVLACALLLLSALLVSRVAGLAHDVWRARDWTSVQASILHASMSSAREPRKLGYYETRVKYRYTFRDKQYEATRLVFTETRGETAEIWDGQWLSTIVSFLEDSRREGRPVQVFVNPADPGDAVVFRGIVWGNYLASSLLMLLSGLFPIGIAGITLRGRHSRASLKFLQFGIALVYLLIALTGATVAAAV